MGSVVLHVDTGRTEASFDVVIVAPFDAPKLLGVRHFLEVAALRTDSQMWDASLFVCPWANYVD